MDITNRLKNAVAAFRKTNNDTTLGIDPNTYLKFGSRRMPSSWTVPEITDQDFYTGYGFAVINKRANRSVVLGKKFLYTEAKEDIVKKANDNKTTVTHPYIDLIRSSTDFAERDFWYNISTYLDLEGVYYLMAVRTVTQSGKVGNIQKFTLLNPYWVRQIINSKGELGGYVENNPLKGQRDIQKEMIIPIKLLNPFDPSMPYSLADAARDSQFTLKQANDYARNSINGNINSPGILSSAIELPDDQFDNFVQRVKSHGRGEPLFGNGAGTVSWVDMQIDLDKAALDKINSINRDVLLAISGLSKTGVGVEESGTGREVSRTQKDDFTENAIMPQIENIIDALNLDYRRYYPDQWTKNNYAISLDNPLETSHDAELVDVDIRDSQFELYQTLVDKGYDDDLAAKYAKGEIDITDLGEPTNPPKLIIPPTPQVEPIDPTAPKDPLTKPVKPPAVLTPVDPPQPPTAPATPAAPTATPPAKPVKKPAAKPTKKPVAKKANTLVQKVNNQLAARDIPDLYDGMDIELDKLGCIMLDTNTIPVMTYVNSPDDVYDDGEPHTGLVGETEPHVTLLFGLLENGNEWKQKVDQVLTGWSCPSVTVDEVTAFDLGDQYAIVALLEKTPELIDGHERLTLLPHINTFSEYTPHITLAYVKYDESIRDKWVSDLDAQYAGKEITTKNINYGNLPVQNSLSKDKMFQAYEGYPIPVVQYLEDHKDEITSLTEKQSAVWAVEGSDKVVIDHVEADNNSLIAVVDENTFIKLADFKQDADKEAILEILNKRYKNQLVAIKKKIDFSHNHDDTAEVIKNAVFDKKAQIDQNTNDLLTSAQAAEDKLYQWYVDQIGAGISNPHPSDNQSFINSLTLPFATYFTVMFPIYASHRSVQTAKDLGIKDDLPVTAITVEVKNQINDFAKREATSHVQTLEKDLENALAVIRAKTTDPTEMKQMFELAYTSIRANRSAVIANSAATKIFNLSQYEADLQFLTRADLVDKAYKVLFSLSGDPCPFCASLIASSNANPIPFTDAFAKVGQTLHADGETYTFNYEDIVAGNVHPNCRCAYKLIVKNDVA